MDLINIPISTAPAAYRPIFTQADIQKKNGKIDSAIELKRVVMLGQKELKGGFRDLLEYLDVETEGNLKNFIKGPVLIIKVIDGDTADTEIGRIRYIGIDTAETKHPTKAKEYYGQEASSENTRLANNQQVELSFDQDMLDQYDRFLAYVFIIDNATFLNQALIENGYALASSWPPNTMHRENFKKSQRYAYKKKAGLWKNIVDLAPDDAKNNISRIVRINTTIRAVTKKRFRGETAEFIELKHGKDDITVISRGVFGFNPWNKITVVGKLLKSGRNYSIIVEDPEVFIETN